MAIAQFNVFDNSFVQVLPGYSRPRANLTPAQRLDYTFHFPNCPADLQGKGEAPIVYNHATLGVDQTHGPLPAYNFGSLSGNEWVIAVPAVDMTPQAIADSLAAAKAGKKAQITAQFRDQAYSGISVEVSPGVLEKIRSDETAIVQLSRGVERMARLGLASTNAVTAAGSPITITPVLAGSLISAIEDHHAACQEREHALYTLVDAASDKAAVESIDQAAGWP